MPAFPGCMFPAECDLESTKPPGHTIGRSPAGQELALASAFGGAEGNRLASRSDDHQSSRVGAD